MRPRRRRTPTVLFVLTLAAASATTTGALTAAAARARSQLAGDAAALRLTVTPIHVRQGGTMVLHGAGFPAQARVLLQATPPQGPRRALGTARAGSSGTFDATIRIARRAALGVYVAIACPGACTRQATVSFRVMQAR
ncbi:MAG: hypothetical protein JWQ48_519 [Conexibacter sp.]|jgi:hypothetical protein|nr:hypothetical protein [Conexibacter sp.]